MSNIKEKIEKSHRKEYYNKLIDGLKINGLIDAVSDPIVDGKVNYISLVINVVAFLQKNKKLFSNFTQKTFEKIVILSVDEILRSKGIDIDEEELQTVLTLLKSSFLVRGAVMFIKDTIIKGYYRVKSIKCCCCKKNDDPVDPVPSAAANV